MNRTRVLLLYTGGTIGMRPGAAGLAPHRDFIADLQHFVARDGVLKDAEIVFALHEPLIDSAEAAPTHWWSIAQTLWGKQKSFDSAVMLHGTDTLAYTASALSFLLRGFGKPI